jgi:hypothetical protein
VSGLDTGQSIAFVETIRNLPVEKQWGSYSKEQVPTAGGSKRAFNFVRQFSHLAVTLGDVMCAV